MSMGGCLNRFDFILAEKSIHFCTPHRTSSSVYSCCGFPTEVNIFFEPPIIASGVLYLMGATSAVLVKEISIATSPYLVLEATPFDSISMVSISNSNSAPGENKHYVVGLVFLGCHLFCSNNSLHLEVL